MLEDLPQIDMHCMMFAMFEVRRLRQRCLVSALIKLDIEREKANKWLKELHLHAVVTHHATMKTLRNKLENTKMSK